MKILVVYSTRSGSTKEIARRIVDKIQAEDVQADMADVKSRPTIEGYDCVIIGASVRAGQVPANIRSFCLRHEQELLEKRLCLYVSSLARGERAIAYIDANFPPRLVAHSSLSATAGGRIILDELGVIPRTMLKIAAKISEDRDELDDEAIAELAAAAVQ